MPIADFKALVREQYFMLLIDAAGAIAAIPSMLPRDTGMRAQAFELIKHVVEAAGMLPSDGQQRLRHIKTLFLGNGDSKPGSRHQHEGWMAPSKLDPSGSTKK